MCTMKVNGRCRSSKHFLERCLPFRSLTCKVAVGTNMMSRLVIAIVIGVVAAGSISLGGAVFGGREHADREAGYGSHHPYQWERTVCFKCHSSSAGPMMEQQASAERGVR